MKKMRMYAAAAMLVMGLTLSACGGSDDSDKGSKEASAKTESTAKGGYSFTSGSVKVEMGADASKVVEELGEADYYFESESCAFEGLDKVYTYPGFKLNTYPVDDKDYVLSVVFMDDTVETEEGICIGSTKDEVTEAYGEPTEEKGSSMIYEKGETKITFGVKNDEVSTVEISAIVEE